MDRQRYQYIIVGGGCAGLWLLHELSTQHYSSILVEQEPLGAYASTRNQSWLHSGALYAVGLETLASRHETECAASMATGHECIQAFEEMVRFCPEAFQQESECLFAFNNEHDLTLASENLETLGVHAQALTLDQLIHKEPSVFVTHGAFRFGLATKDIPFNSHVFLSHLLRTALDAGGEIHKTERKIAGLEIGRDGRSWVVKDDKRVIEGDILIFAAGALMPRMMKQLDVLSNLELKIQKCLVLVLHQRLCDRVISLRRAGSGDLNLVPFENGTTVNLGGTDGIAADETDEHFDEARYADVVNAVGRYIPGIQQCGAHFYVCQKLNNARSSSHDRQEYGNRHYFWAEVPSDDLYFFYPGKFTLGKIGAREFVNHLSSLYSSTGRSSLVALPTSPPSMAVPYQGDPSEILVRTDDKTLERQKIRNRFRQQ